MTVQDVVRVEDEVGIITGVKTPIEYLLQQEGQSVALAHPVRVLPLDHMAAERSG